MGPGILWRAWGEDPLGRCPPAALGQVELFTGQWEDQCPVPMTTNLPQEHATHFELLWGGAGLCSCPMTGAMEEQPPEAPRTFQERQEQRAGRPAVPTPGRQAGLGESPLPSPGQQQRAEGGADGA